MFISDNIHICANIWISIEYKKNKKIVYIEKSNENELLKLSCNNNRLYKSILTFPYFFDQNIIFSNEWKEILMDKWAS